MQFSTILVAVDGSETSDKVFDAAAQLVKLSGGRLLIIHVISVPAAIADPLLAVGATDMGELMNEIERRGKALLEKYVTKADKEYKISTSSTSSAPSSSVETILAQGRSPADAIIREAESKSADLVVIGSRGFGGAKGFFLGSVPNSILHHSRIPVLLVK